MLGLDTETSRETDPFQHWAFAMVEGSRGLPLIFGGSGKELAESKRLG